MKAAANGHFDLCVALLQAGADATLTDLRGFTAEQHALVFRPELNIHIMLKSFVDGGDLN